MNASAAANSPPRLVRSIGALQSKTFDLAIIGGGVTGATVAYYAASAGLSVALLEAQDFASGRSGETSSLIYGGLSPMASSSFGLAKKSSLDAQYSHQRFSHLVTPVTMTVPLRSRLQWWKTKLGAVFREVLGGIAELDRHVSLNAEQIQSMEPMLDPYRFPFALSFREYLRDDSRLTIAVLRAATAVGAACSNYLRVESIERRRDQFFLHSTDELSGAALAVRCRSVVNATGAWSQRVLAEDISVGEAMTGLSSDPKRDVALGKTESSLGNERISPALSKSVHIAVPHQRLPLHQTILMNTPDRRAVFARPHGQVTYIGAREVPYEREAGHHPKAEIEDIQYLLAPLTDYFPDAQLKPADVVSSWASLGPVLQGSGNAVVGGAPSKRELSENRVGVITVVGGRFTGHRSLAAMTLEQVSRMLSREITLSDAGDVPGCGIEMDDIDAEVARVSSQFQIDEPGARRLVGLYGSEVRLVLGSSPTRLTRRVFEEEVDWAVTTEGAISLDDVLYRRLRVAWFEPRALAELLPLVADRMAEILGWDAAERLRQRINAEVVLAEDLAAIPLGG